MKPSQLMLQFLRAWLDWATAGGREGNEFGFNTGMGLCYNSRKYIHALRSQAKEAGVLDAPAFSVHGDTLEHELRSHFKRQRLDPDYPFNRGDGAAYEHDSFENRHHLNHRRLQWVRDMLEDRP